MAFSYSSAINNLVAGAAENIADVVTCFTDIKTVLNNGITGTDHLSASAAVADTQLATPNNATYKQIIPSMSSQLVTLVSGTTRILTEGALAFVVTDNTAGYAVFYLDPAWYTAGAKTNKYNLRFSLLTNATAPTSTFTAGLYPVTAVAGGGAANSITLGAVTAGSTAAIVAPALNTLNQASSGDFTAPAAGYYAIAVPVTVANMAGGSSVVVRVILQHRQV